MAVAMNIDTLYGRLANETRRLLTELLQQGVTGDELIQQVQAGLANLSDTPIETAGRESTSKAFNLGRNLVVQERVDEVKEAVRTEVLDANTCAPCRNLDGKTVPVNSEDYFKFMPPNFCEGRDRCRGFYLLRAA